MDDNKSQAATRVPETDDAGRRKVFATPDIVLSKQGTKAKYPWDTLKIGQSFEILYSDMKKSSVAPFVSRMAKKHKKKFKVTDMPDYSCYLVSCIPMTTEQAIATSGNIVEALNKVKNDG